MKMGIMRLGMPAESCCTVNAVSSGASKKSTSVPVFVAGAVDEAGVERSTLFGALLTSSLTINSGLVVSAESGVSGNSVGNSGGNSATVEVGNGTALGETEVGDATVGVGCNASVRVVKATVEVGNATVGACDGVKTCCSCCSFSVGS